MNVKTRTVISLVCNAVIVLVTTGIVISYFFVESKILKNGYESFMFFMTDSNILAAIGAALVMICDVKILQGKRETVARDFTLVKYAGVVSLMLTFFTVLVLLIPAYGIGMQWGGTGFHMHLSAPILSFVSFVFLEEHTRIKMSDTIIGLLPTVIYGAVYFTEVIIVKGWMDFYLFNIGGMWFVTMPVIIGISFLFCLIVRALRNKVLQRRSK